MKVAIQGESGSFSHEAAGRLHRGAAVVPCATFTRVFDLVVARRVDAGVIPIENTLAGSMAQNLDLLLARDVFVRRELTLPIEHHLIAAPGARLERVRRVLSHPVALEQCRRFFRRHPRLEAVPFYDTAGAVRHVVGGGDPEQAALAGAAAAAVHGGVILRRGLQDHRHNSTRFFLIARGRRPARGADKTSLAFAMRDVPGALFKALAIFALRDLNLSRIESRPARHRPFEYVFFVDVLRGLDGDMRHALRHLAEIARFVKVLGVYPAAGAVPSGR